MPKVPRTLHCKKASSKQLTGTLQAAITAELNARSIAMNRAEQTSSTTNRYRVIGQHYAWKKALAGILFEYEPGAKAASMIKDQTATQLSLDHFSAPPDKGGNTREWLGGLLYFLILENYLVLIQSSSVRYEQLEEHFGWLLTSNNNNPTMVVFLDQPPKNTAKLISESHVKSVVIGGSLFSPAAAMPSDGNAANTSKKQVLLKGRLLDAVKAALASGGQGFNWHDGLDGNLEAKLELTYRRNTTESAQELLDKLATAFHGADGVDAELVLNNGDRITQSELRLISKKNIEAKDGVLGAADAFDQMYDWLESLINTGQL